MSVKQDDQIQKPDSGQKFVLILAAAGLVVILLTSLVYLFNAGSMVKQTGLPVPSDRVAARPLDSGQMPAEIPQAMLEALAQRGLSLADLGMGGVPAASGTAQNNAGLESLIQELQTKGDDLDTLLDLAEMFTNLGDLANAQTFVNRALVSAPSEPRSYYQQGRIYQSRGSFQQAADLMELSLSMGDSAQVRHDLALIYADALNNKVKAVEHLSAALALPNLSPELRAHYQEELQALRSQ